MLIRPRRRRANPGIRRLVRETSPSTNTLVQPLFVGETIQGREEIASMPGQYRWGISSLVEEVDRLSEAGVRNILLFGIPEKKDPLAAGAYDEEGVIQRAVRAVKKKHPDCFVITDVCLCEYTDHGHCGILRKEKVDNDATLPILEKIALSHARAGADMVAPSDMMDCRVRRIRGALDGAGFCEIPILSYSVKYASGFYSPFRGAADNSPAFGDRRSYQMDYHNKREALLEALLDIEEGADILMVKPAMNYLDILSLLREKTSLPLAAYSVSGEYSMVKAAAAAGFVDERRIACEMAIAAKRAGAGIYISYYAKELAGWLREEEEW